MRRYILYFLSLQFCSNLGISYSINFPNDQMFSVEAYSSSNRNVIFGTWQTNQIWYFSYTFPNSSVNYGIDIGCTGGSCVAMNSALSLVLESRDIFVVAYMDDSQIETIITVGLSNGTYVPTAKVQSSAPLYSSSRAIEAIGEYGDDDKIFILSSGGNEAYIIIYDLSEDKVMATYFLTTIILYTIAVKYGYLYVGHRDLSSYFGRLGKYDFHDTYLTSKLLNEVSVTIQSSATFTTPTSATIEILWC